MEHTAAALAIPPPGHSISSVPLIPSMRLCYKAELQSLSLSLQLLSMGSSVPDKVNPALNSCASGPHTERYVGYLH